MQHQSLSCEKTVCSPLNASHSFYLETRMGIFECFENDVFLFPNGLVGFEHTHYFAMLEKIPSLSESVSYGMMQSLENKNVVFILFFPPMDDNQIARIHQEMNSVRRSEDISVDDIVIAFLVIINKDEGEGGESVDCIKDAPLIFIKSLNQGFQLVLNA
jgi:flagellar assembly factor FliW